MKGLVPSGSNWWMNPWEYFEQILKNNDLTASFTDADLVYCSHILVQEFAKPGDDTKISKFIFTEHVAKTAADIRNQRNKALAIPPELNQRIKAPKQAAA